MRYYLIAGERSGDLHASNLIKALKLKDGAGEFRGFGGDYMEEAGARLVVHYRRLAFMGFVEVLTNLNTIRKFIKLCKTDIISYQPDVVILVDYGGFNLRIAKFCKSINKKVFYYITPKVWAWNQRRAYKLKANVDRAFVILPFEKVFFKKFDWDVDYVGNPVLDAVKAHKASDDFKVRNGLSIDKVLVALLPGSRTQELKGVIPIMAEVVKRHPEYEFAVAAIDSLEKQLYAPFKGLPNIKFIVEDTYNLLQNCVAAVVTSGTATLETALFRVPQVVVYKTSWLSYKIARALIKVKYISLVNLIAEKEVVKELIQADFNADAISQELDLIIETKKREEILIEYERIYTILDIGFASVNAANLIIRYLK